MRLSYIAILFIAFSTASALPMPIPESDTDTAACEHVLAQMLTPAEIAQVEGAAKPGHNSITIPNVKPGIDVEVFLKGTPPAVIEHRKTQLGHSLLDSSCRLLAFRHV
ncbi:hypothetical protein F5887DRAFT_931994 [Amanita rubescens]|nr:hypothetical protein F5887DRAFT_931994 [Amanita rubescens]